MRASLSSGPLHIGRGNHPPYICQTNSFPRGSPEAERALSLFIPPILVEQIHFQEPLQRLKEASSPRSCQEALQRLKEALSFFILLILIEQIHFQEALQMLKEASSLFIHPYISRTNSFPRGSPEAEKGFEPLHTPYICRTNSFSKRLSRSWKRLWASSPPLYQSNKFISKRLQRLSYR